MRRRIILVTPTYGRASGGIGVSCARIAAGLAETRAVEVLVPDPTLPVERYETDPPDPRGVVVHRFWWREGGAGGAFLADVVEARLAAAQGAGAASADASRGAAPAAGAADCAVAAFSLGPLAFPSLFAARRAGAATFAFGRGNDVDQDLFGDGAFAVAKALELSRRCFAVSREMADKLKTFMPSLDVQFVANAVDPKLFAPAPRRPGPRLTVGLLGEIKAKKGLDLLLEALDYDRFDLVIAGRMREPEAKHLHGLLTLRPELRARIDVRPYADDPASVAALYQSLDVVSVPSVHEGMANVMLEAMASGKVVVASAVGGAPDVITDSVNGFLFTSRDPAALRQALARADAAVRTGEGRLEAAARARILEGFTPAHERAAYESSL